MKATSSWAADLARRAAGGADRRAPRLHRLDVGWAVFSAGNLVAIAAFPCWRAIPFYLIWITFTIMYGYRTWPMRPTLCVLGLVMLATALPTYMDVMHGTVPGAELTEVPLMAVLFLAMVWHAHRKLAAERKTLLVSEENARLLRTQRRFLQDASHQLRTPITIALGHAELLAGSVTAPQEARDIRVVLGELDRLRKIAERLLVIAASEDPEFLRPEDISLDLLIMEVIRRWRPTADRHWQVGRLDRVTVQADGERLDLAVDALVENAVRHTGQDDVIKLSVIKGWPDQPVRMVVADSGNGIPPDQLHLIFDRFRTGDGGGSRGTGLGLALVRAVARAHGGSVRVHSTPGVGSEFEVLLPAPGPASPPDVPASPPDGQPLAGSPQPADGQKGSARL